jgi:hypothetical protein
MAEMADGAMARLDPNRAERSFEVLASPEACRLTRCAEHNGAQQSSRDVERRGTGRCRDVCWQRHTKAVRVVVDITMVRMLDAVRRRDVLAHACGLMSARGLWL